MKPSKIKRTLNQCIENVCNSKNEYCFNPKTNFTRNKKLPMRKVIKTILSFGAKSLNNELLDIFGNDHNIPTVSALVQQRSKIKYSAFETIFRSFTKQAAQVSLMDGYRFIAVDGSSIQTPIENKNDDTLVRVGNNTPYRLYHLNALYDLNSRIYLDAIVQNYRENNECRAFCDMVDRYVCDVPTVFIADRNYESYNNMAHIQQKGHFYLIRIKDCKTNGMFSAFDLPETDEFDLPISLNLSRKLTNKMKELYRNRNCFKFIPHSSTFDFLPAKSRKNDPAVFFYLKFRLVRFELSPGKYEVVITNLSTSSFPPDRLKKLYFLRWGIETSFRSLKYSIGLLHFHSKKSEHILQEIFANLTMYNFTELTAASVSIPKAKRKRIHSYKINFSVAVNVCRKFFLGLYAPKFVETMISKHILPIRSNLCNPRFLHPKPAVSFIYRVA